MQMGQWCRAHLVRALALVAWKNSYPYLRIGTDIKIFQDGGAVAQQGAWRPAVIECHAGSPQLQEFHEQQGITEANILGTQLSSAECGF